MNSLKTLLNNVLTVFVLTAILLPSCTSGLEERIDNLETKLTQVIKDVSQLQDELAKIEAKIPTDALSKIDALTKRIETLENSSMTDDEIKKAIDKAKDELSTTISSIPRVSSKRLDNGNIELTFTVGTSAPETIEFVDPSQITITKNSNNTTTIKVGDKEFTYPTSVIIPSTITSIQVTTDPIDAPRMTRFTLKMWIGTNDGKQVELTKENLIITNALTKSSFFQEVDNLNIINVHRNGDQLNEFNVEIEAVKNSDKANYALAIKQTNNTQRSNAFTVTIEPFLPLVKSQFTPFTLGGAVTDYNSVSANLLGTITIDKYTPARDTKQINFKYLNEKGAEITTGLVDIYEVSAYEILNIQSYSDAVIKTGLSSSVLKSNDNLELYTKKCEDISKNISDFSYYSGCSVENANGVINFVTPSYNVTSSTSTRYFVVMLCGRVVVDNVQIRQYGIIEVKSNNTVRYTLPTTTFEAETSTTSIEITDAHRGMTYEQLTGLKNVNISKINATISRVGGDEVPQGVSLDAKLNGTSNLSFSIKPNQSKLDDGDYVVTVTDSYAPDRSLVFTMNLTITRAKVSIANAESLGAGYSSDGTFNSFSVSPISHKFAFESVVRPVSTLEYGVDYKLFYRLYTIETDGSRNYLDDLSSEDIKIEYRFNNNPYTELQAAEVEGTNIMAYDKSYFVEAYVVYKSKYAIVVESPFCFKYATVAKIDGFQTVSPVGNYTKELTRGLKFGGSDVIDVSYIFKATKPFYFASIGDYCLDVEDTDLNNYSKRIITNISYSVDAVPYSSETMVGGGTSSNIRFVSFKSGEDSNLNQLSYAQIKKDARLCFGPINNVSDIVEGKTVKQPITVKVTDIWGRVSELKINVMITPK